MSACKKASTGPLDLTHPPATLRPKPEMDSEELELIYKIMEKITSTADLAVVAADIVRTMSTALDCIGGALLLVDEKAQVLRPYTYSQVSVFVEKVIPLLTKPFQDHLFDLKNPQNLTTRTVTEQRTFVGSRYEEFMTPVLSTLVAKLIQKVVRMKTIVTAPAVVNGRVVGVLMIGFRESELSPRKQKLVDLFADQCAVAINNAKQYEELQALLDRQSDVMAMSAHALRTPLSVALFQSEEIVELLAAGESEKARAAAAVTHAALTRLTKTLQKVFATLEYERGQPQLHPAEIRPAEFLTEMERLFRPQLEEHGRQLSVQVSLPPDLRMEMDTEKMQYLLEQLVENALSATTRGGQIVLTAARKGPAVLFTVSDDGAGVPDDRKEQIFEKACGQGVYQSEGLGLGLFLCRQIAELHGGKIWVEDTSGGGATFRVRLPLVGDRDSPTEGA